MDVPLCTDGMLEDVLLQYKNTVFRTAYAYLKNRSDAEDITQEVFLRYVKSRPSFTDENHQKAWFIRVTINCSKSLLASAWFRRTGPLEEEDWVFDNDAQSDVFNTVMSLPPKYRVVVYLYYYEEYPVKEIAVLTSRKESTIQSQLMKARALLKEALGEP